MPIKPSTTYFKNDKSQYQCKICNRTFELQNSAIRHSHSHDGKPKNLSQFTYNENNISFTTERLLLWKASHGIAMSAFEDPLITDLFPEDQLMSRKTGQKNINQMSSQIIQMNYKQASHKKISLIIDGGTVLHQKWLAIGFLFRTQFGIRFNILDLQLFDQATSEIIKEKIQFVSEKIKNEFDGEVVGVCTDNASNFCKVFMGNEKDVNFVPLGIVRVSCACHTIQLCLKDLYECDKFYRNFVELIKIIPSKISYLSRERAKMLGICSFPPHQSQRWDSVFLTLQYIIKNIGAISSLFTINELAYLQLIDLFNLAYLLLPIHIFTCTCEADDATQSTVYIAYRGLKQSLKLNRSNRAKLLLDLIKNRFKNTADIKLSKLAYFTTNAGIWEKRERFPHVSSGNVKNKNDENAIKLDNEMKFINSFSPTIRKICEILSLDFDNVFNGFEILMQFAEPSNRDVSKYPGPLELRNLFVEATGDHRSYIELSHFLDIVQVLPASEASAERVFARMRDLYNKKQTNLSVQSLKSNLILSFYAQKVRTMDFMIDEQNQELI